MSPSSPKPPIAQALDASQYASVRFHVPGHQGRSPLGKASPGVGLDWLINDLTELDTLDDLAHPSGCVADSQQQAAFLYGVGHSFYLSGGSTLGLQAALLALAKPHEVILLPRTAHRAIVHGLILTGAFPAWFFPQLNPHWGVWQGVSLHDVVTAHKGNPQVTGIVIPSPTYEGFASEVKAIADYCQQHGLWLVVDEAHGSLLPVYPTLSVAKSLPVSATQTAATVVIQSLHKGAGAITPAAIAHLPKHSTLSPQRFQQALNVLQTSSPSWPLLANSEACTRWLWSPNAQEHLNYLIQRVNEQARRVNNAEIGFEWYVSNKSTHDPLAILIRHGHLPPAIWACEIEATVGIAYESLNTHSALYKVGLGATPEDIKALANALLAYQPQDSSEGYALLTQPFDAASLPPPQVVLCPREAWLSDHETVPLFAAVGRIAAETYAPCPPGVPLWAPGERIQPGHLSAWKGLEPCESDEKSVVEPSHDPPDVIVVREGALR
ncbi:MAG: hypothetical protein QE263_01225 [Vampirovibrionales bacterium]|nr:hypothetical protein [Vampirovibrionales bacterium]